MKNIFNSLSIKLIVFLSILFACIIAFIYFFQFVPIQKKLYDSQIKEKLDNIVNLYQNSLSKALQNSDDLTILNSIENIMKYDGIYTAYIINKTGKVITHNETSEWNRIYTDPFSKNAVSAASSLIQNTLKSNKFLFSCPISSCTTLCVGFSKEKTEKNIENTRQKFIFISLILFLATILSIFVIVNTLFASPFKKLEHFINSVTLSKGGTIPELGKDDFGRIASQINTLLSSVQSASPSHSERYYKQDQKMSLLIKDLSNHISSGLMIIDAENRIISVNSQFLVFLSMTGKDIIGKHLLDAVKMPELFSLIAKSAEKPGTAIIESILGKEIKVITVDDAGVILFLK
ncbi:MAG: hypothetical protein NT145_00565 [Elusimicrobia bacterium]|nr:hypothetical protein [Elusimicrobiota bacterium]